MYSLTYLYCWLNVLLTWSWLTVLSVTWVRRWVWSSRRSSMSFWSAPSRSSRRVITNWYAVSGTSSLPSEQRIHIMIRIGVHDDYWLKLLWRDGQTKYCVFLKLVSNLLFPFFFWRHRAFFQRELGCFFMDYSGSNKNKWFLGLQWKKELALL